MLSEDLKNATGSMARADTYLEASSLMGVERLKMSELMERVRALGAPNDLIDECMDHADVRMHTPLQSFLPWPLNPLCVVPDSHARSS